MEFRSWEGGASWPGLSKAPVCAVPTALAEILSVKDISGRKLFYVHYIDCEFWVAVRWGCRAGLGDSLWHSLLSHPPCCSQ